MTMVYIGDCMIYVRSHGLAYISQAQIGELNFIGHGNSEINAVIDIMRKIEATTKQ
jgi:hypothetical protein